MTSTTLTIISILALLISVHAAPLTHFNESAFSPITTYTALGDSYATGNGAGTIASVHSICCLFSDSYPLQLAKAIGPVRFHSAACGGATSTSVIWHQRSSIGESDLVTLTVGGNEVDFFAVLNECVYQWRPQGTCEGELRKSRELIESSCFVERFAEMVKLALRRMKPSGRLLVTGYATFFNEDTTACDGVTFSITNPEQLLTRRFRREVNELVRMLNQVIGAAVEASGAEYVDIDSIFQGHRFCEDGVHEPDDSRSDTWFFNLKYDQVDAVEFELSQDYSSQEVFSAGFGQWYTDVVKVFHPTKEGHGGIRDAILTHLESA